MRSPKVSLKLRKKWVGGKKATGFNKTLEGEEGGKNKSKPKIRTSADVKRSTKRWSMIKNCTKETTNKTKLPTLKGKRENDDIRATQTKRGGFR